MTHTDPLERTLTPQMAFYRHHFSSSQRWDGTTPLEGKKVLVYCEQGFGDIIQFCRYFPRLKELGAHLILFCPRTLHRLLKPFGDEFVDKDTANEVPPHDCHVLSMSLPFLLNEVEVGHEAAPYIDTPPPTYLGEHEHKFKIGIAWEGNPSHSNNTQRCCPLEYFLPLTKLPNTSVFMIQKDVTNQRLIRNCEDFNLYSVPLTDFYDTASLLGSLDLIITVDTSVLHLAGAIGKKAIGLLSIPHDPRWHISNWYESIDFVKQEHPGNWDSVFDKLYEQLNYYEPRKTVEVLPPNSILITGGIGDFLSLESYMGDKDRNEVETVYYATRAYSNIREILVALPNSFPKLKNHICLWDDFSSFFAIYSKMDCHEIIEKLPSDWPQVEDWSMIGKFSQIEYGLYRYNESSLLHAPLTSLDGIALPKDYVVLVSASPNDARIKNRTISHKEWNRITRYLKDHKLKGVLLNSGHHDAPFHPLITDLSNKTTLLQSIEILKRAKGYIGIDSCLSVLASKLFDEHLCVKSNNPHLRRWKHIYYAPKTSFDFVMSEITFETKRGGT